MILNGLTLDVSYALDISIGGNSWIRYVTRARFWAQCEWINWQKVESISYRQPHQIMAHLIQRCCPLRRGPNSRRGFCCPQSINFRQYRGSINAIFPEFRIYWTSLYVSILVNPLEIVASVEWWRLVSALLPLYFMPMPMTGWKKPYRYQIRNSGSGLWLGSFLQPNKLSGRHGWGPAFR